jgi:hypothetical protein
MRRWHIGTVVQDISESISDYRRLGECRVSNIAHLPTQTYDVESDEVVDEPLEVAWVRDSYGETFELIAPLTTRGPQARFLAQRAGPSHVAFWCSDPVATAKALLDDGAHLVLLSLAETTGWRERVDLGGPSALLPMSAASYLRLPSGLMIELNQERGSIETMIGIWGEGVLATLPQGY